MVNTIYLFSFVETARKFIIAELSIRKLGSSSVLINKVSSQNVIKSSVKFEENNFTNFLLKISSKGIISTDKDLSLRVESSAIINLRGVSTKLNNYN